MMPTGEPDHHEPPIQATIARYDDHPDECTLHPAAPDEDSRMTEWITAESGGYFALVSCR